MPNQVRKQSPASRDSSAARVSMSATEMSEDRSRGMYHSLIGKPSLRVVLVMGLLIGLCSLLLLAACGGGNSAKGGAGQEHNKKEIGSLRVENASGDSASANSGQIVGENVEGSSFDLRVLDYFTAEQYYYVIGRVGSMAEYVVFEEDAISQAGKFVVVNYSVTNTSPFTIEPVLSAQLHVKGADGKTEVYEETDDFPPPRARNKDIVRDGMRLSQFIFDVPTEVEPELLAVAEEATTATGSAELEVVDLRESDPQGPRPEEILALQSEYFNMTDFERAYDLYAQESKDRVSEQVFVSAQKEGKQQGASYTVPTSYSIPSVEIEGDRATIHVVGIEPPVEREGLHLSRVTHPHEDEAVLDDEGWRIMMGKAELFHFKCWETEGRLC
jgi:hypothetical protein